MGKIAILMSTYNGEKYLKCQIDSILSQNLKIPFQLIIRDDGSTDNTVSIIETYKDERITLIEGNNIGANKSFISLIKKAKEISGEYSYYSFADQDDQWDFDKLSVALKFINSYSLDVPVLYGSASCHVDANLNPLEERQRRNVKELTPFNTLIQNIVPGHTYVFNKKFLEMIPDDLDENQIYFHDSFILNIANIAGVFLYDPYPHTNYRQHGNNVMGNTKNPLKWLAQRSKRIINGDSKLYAKQIEYLYELYHQKMRIEVCDEVNAFLASRKNIIKRISYIRHTKMYRQSNIQTALFKILYVVGGYNNK